MTQASRILVINAKGGCGKTTVATNLAVAYARQGWRVALVDQDSQECAAEWAERRADHLPRVEAVARRRASMYQTQAWRNRLPHGVERAVIDAASVAGAQGLDDCFRECDVFLVPMLPSAIDIRAGAKFIAGLLSHRAYRLRPVPIGVVANRVALRSPAHDALQRFLAGLSVPQVATFTDNALYLRAAEAGAGVLDFPQEDRHAQERSEWGGLVRWVEDALASRGRPTVKATAPGAAPRPAQPARAVASEAVPAAMTRQAISA